jgi:MoaA/NifB/PqqE/SkfB family radical SAM enzyme
MPAPKFLKVVPTIACNLKCPMCYQLDEPAARLPGDLFASLEPWIATASELQIMGGEAFVAKQCLDWFRRVDPVRFPRCRLAAITNGLGFTPATCELMALRRWSWILVSIDAASERVYAKTRGGDFGSLLRGLDRLARVRAQSDEGFEIRFGFTLQKSNLKDALPFLDLCATYRALPQFTMVFGDWHGESPLNKRDLDRFLATIEMVDAAL